MASIYKDFYFFLSADINADLKIHIGRLELVDVPKAWRKAVHECIVAVRAVDGGLPLHSGHRSTVQPIRKADAVEWNEWLALPVKIRDLPKTAQLVRV
jgi:hypothetical protein